MPPTEYPETCLRGVPHTGCLCEDGTMAHFTLFPFSDDESRASEWIDESINWMDDGGAIDVLLNQKKENGELQFRVGIAMLPRAELDRLKRVHRLNDRFNYERREIEGNPYHGNLRLRRDVQNPLKGMFRSALAIACTIKKREDLPQHD
jgi:hypothetical protein